MGKCEGKVEGVRGEHPWGRAESLLPLLPSEAAIGAGLEAESVRAPEISEACASIEPRAKCKSCAARSHEASRARALVAGVRCGR